MDIHFFIEYTELEYHAATLTLKYYPDFLIPYSEISRDSIFNDYEKVYNKYKEQLSLDKEMFFRKKVDINKYFKQLFRDEQNFPQKTKSIGTILKIFPRQIDENMFLYPIQASFQRKLEVVVHEINHFVFYNTAKSYGISTNNKTFWLLSELFAVISTWNNLYQETIGLKISKHYICQSIEVFEKINHFLIEYDMSLEFFTKSIDYLNNHKIINYVKR